MPVTFSLADADTRAVVDRAMREFHPVLAEAGVLVGVLFAATDDPDEPSIRSRGAAVAATMQVVSLKDRVLKRVDAQLVIAREVWAGLDADQRLALADHELSHIRLRKAAYWAVLDDRGRPVIRPDGATEEELRFDRDDLGRPKLSSVPGDVDAGDGFSEVIRRHGPASLEYRNLTRAGAWAEKALSGEAGTEPELEDGGDREVDGPTLFDGAAESA